MEQTQNLTNSNHLAARDTNTLPHPLEDFQPQPEMSKKLSTSSRSNPQLLTLPPETHWQAVEIIASNVDLLTEILLCVPAKHLIKFKCVSKHWLSLISDSNFSINHTRRNLTPPVSGIYLRTRSRHSTKPSKDQFFPVSFAGNCRTSLPTLSFLEGALLRIEASALTSSNGLMLFCNGDGNYIICNLTTQKFIKLPKSHGISPVCCSYNHPYLIFDPSKSPYYKVVLVSRSGFAIYSSKCASWKYVDVMPEIEISRRSAICNGEIIWMHCEGQSGSCSRHGHIYSLLNVDSEELTVTQVPTDPNLRNIFLYFGECGGRLLLIQLPSHDVTEFSILEMDRHDFCWIVKDRVDLKSLVLPYRISRCVIKVISIVKGTLGNDMAVVLYNRGKVISCNLECRTMKVIRKFGPDEIETYALKNFSPHSFQFIESLSPV